MSAVALDQSIDAIMQKADALPPEDRVRLALKLKAEFFKNDLFAYSKYLVGFKEMTWRTHGELIEALESPAKRKLICFPRGSFKSSIAVVSYATWRLIKDPSLRILLDSELYTNSANFLSSIRGHFERQDFIELFGTFKGSKWGEGAITIAQRPFPRVEASITCGGIETTKVGQHYDLIIGDDYNSPKNSNTPEKCQAIIDHFKYNLSILEPQGEYIIIGTRYAEMDMIGWILRELLNLNDLADGLLPGEKAGTGLIGV
jgi:hypothetical protein